MTLLHLVKLNNKKLKTEILEKAVFKILDVNKQDDLIQSIPTTEVFRKENTYLEIYIQYINNVYD